MDNEREVIDQILSELQMNNYLKDGISIEELKRKKEEAPYWARERMDDHEKCYIDKIHSLKDSLREKVDVGELKEDEAIEILKEEASRFQQNYLS